MTKIFVYDGDTVLWGRDSYRIDGVDTFELRDPGGVQARDATRRMLDAGFKLKPIAGATGGYGRKLGLLEREGDISGQQALVNAGLGGPLPGHMNRTVNPYQNLQREVLGITPDENSIENDYTFRRLAEEARSARLERLNEKLSSPGLGEQGVLPMAQDPEEARGHIRRGLARGLDNTQATFYGFANALGEAAGIDALAAWGEQGVAENIYEAMQNPATVGSWENVDSLADAGIYALEALAEFAPELALDGAITLGAGALATTGVGAPAAAGLIMTRHSLAGIGKSVLRKAGVDAVPNASVVAREGIRRSDLFKEGARFGALGSMYMQGAGESQMNFKIEGIDNPEGALALGVPKALLDLYGFEKILGQAFKGLGKDAITPSNIRELLADSARAAGVASTAEGVTEALQALMDEMAIVAQKPGREVEWAGVIDGLLKGGIGAGGFAGASRAGVGALRMGASVEVPGADAPPQPTLTEPLRDIGAQLDITPEGEGRWYTSGNAEQAKAAAAERGLPVKENPDGSVFVAEQSVLDTIPEEPTQADIARVLGYAQTKDEALADPQGAVVVETRNADGAVLRNQLVGASIAEAVRQLQAEKFPEGQTAIINAESAVAERSEAVQREQRGSEGLPNEAEKPSKKALSEERPKPVSRAALSDRDSLPATEGEVLTAGAGSGPARPLSVKERTPAKAAKKATLPAIDNLEEAGVTSSVQPKSPVDRRAVDRALANRLDRPLPGKGKSLREELASRGVRIAELSDAEALDLAKSLGVEEGVLPRAKGELENAKGETGKRVDNAYKLAAARSIREVLAAKVKGTTKLRGDLQEIADFLGMDPAEARREAYASDAAYIEAVRDALQAKYGKASELVQGIHKSDLSPSELSAVVEVLGGKQPEGFRFREQLEVTTGAKRAAVADRLPTKDKPLPAPEAPKRTGRIEKVLEEVQAPKAAASFMERLSLTRDDASSKVGGLLSSLAEGRSRVPQVMRALQQDGALRKEFGQLIAGAIGGRHKVGGKVSDRKLEQLADSLEAYASALREGIESAQAKAAELSEAAETGYEGRYDKAAAEAGEMQDVELAAVRDAELADAVEALKNVERAEKAIKRFREDRLPERKDAARIPRIDHLIAAIVELEAADIAAVIGMQSTLSEDAQRALREAAVLSAAVHALSDGDIDPNRIAEDIAATTFMRSISPESLGVEGEAGARGGEAPTTARKREQAPTLADVWPTKKEAPKKGEPATSLRDVTPAQAIGALTNHIKRYKNAITSIVRGKVSHALGVDPVQFQVWREWIVERLQSDNADRRRLALIELHEVIGENVDLATLSAVEALLNEGELTPERAERLAHGGVSANTPGVSTQRVSERNEQELSDFSFFNALRRAMAYFRTPVHFGHKKEQPVAGELVYGDGWRRKKGEESIFSSHSVYAIDFETYFDIEGGYSLTSMPIEDYIADPRFKIHGMAVTDQDGNTRYLESEADIKAFLDEVKSGDRPVALAAHNSPFDSRVMAARFGYEPDLWVNTVELSVMARSRHGQQVSHGLEHVAASIGMHKPKEALEETSGKRDLKAELTPEQYQAFVDYARGDANITMEFLRQNEPSINFVRESTEAQRFDRGLAPLSAVPQSHISFGWRNNNSPDAARSALTTVQLGGRNLIEIPIRYTGWESSQIRLFDAIALANYSQRGEARASSAAQAARNLMASLSRLAQGPESTVENGFDPGMQSLELYVPHDDVVIYLDPAKGPVTFGEAIKDIRGMQSRDDTMRAAERTLDQARERVAALTRKFVTLAKKVAAQMMAEQHTASAERAEALDIWSRRLMGETIRDEDVEALAAEHGYNLKELNKQLDKIGTDTVLPKAPKGAKNPEAYRQEGDQLRLADLFNEFLTNLGEIKAASSVRQDLINLGAQTQDRDPEQEARRALADARNKEILTKDPNADPIRPDDIPQHDVDSYMRAWQQDEGVAEEGWSSQRVALDDSGALITEGVEQVGVDGLETLFRAQNEQAARNALAAAKNAENEAGGKQEAVVRPEDITPAEVNKYLESQRPSRSRMFEREEPAPAPKAKPYSVRYNYDGSRVWEGAPNFQDRSRLEGSAKVRVMRFLTRLKELNVPLGNVTLFARRTIEWAIQDTKDAGLREALERAAAVGGSAYVVYNGRAYVLIDRDSTDVDGWILDLAHELGHMVKDRLWGQLLDSDRDALVNDFNAAMEAAGKDVRVTKSDDFLLHEWFADQFTAAVLKAAHRLEQRRLSSILEWLETKKDEEVGKNTIFRARLEMLEILRRIWKAVSESVTVTKGFETFVNNLFRGEYQGKADLQAGDATVRRAADSLAGNQALNRAQLAVNKAKALFNRGVAPTARALMGTAIGQMEAIDKGLAKMLFQRANSDSRGARSYEQLNNALGARLIAEKDRLVAELTKGLPKKQQKQAIQEAFADAFEGSPKTENGKKARKWLDDIAALARREGLRTVQLEPGFPVVVFDREVVERRREEFVTQMKDRLKISAREASELFLGIVEGVGSLEGAIAPGLPVGMHTSTQSILRAIPYAELREAGWLLGEHEAAVQHWLGGMAKRTAWEKTFGGFVVGNPSSLAFQVFGEDDRSGKRLEKAGLLNDEGLVFSANAKFNEGLDRIRESQGQPAVDKFVRLLDGVMGRVGADIPQGIRQTQDMVAAVVNTQVLAFSGIASIPELATAFVRAGGKVGLRDLVFSIREGERLAEAYGHVLSDSTQRIVWQQTGEQYQTPTAQKINFWLFKLNMNQWITNMSRTIAVGVGTQYLMKAAAEGDTAALARLNIDAETVKLWARYGRQAPSITQDARLYEINSQVADAISQFVSEATVSPSRFQATAWGNNPAFKLLWHLKAFLWAYGDIIIGGIWRDMNRRYKSLDGPTFNKAVYASAPILIYGLAVMPLAAAALELRDWIRRLNGTRVEDRSASQYIADVFDRAGGLGPLAFAAGAYKAQSEYGVSFFGSLSPTFGKVDMMFSDYKKDGQIDAAELKWKARQLIPIWSQNKGLPLPWE